MGQVIYVVHLCKCWQYIHTNTQYSIMYRWWNWRL